MSSKMKTGSYEIKLKCSNQEFKKGKPTFSQKRKALIDVRI